MEIPGFGISDKLSIDFTIRGGQIFKTYKFEWCVRFKRRQYSAMSSGVAKKNIRFIICPSELVEVHLAVELLGIDEGATKVAGQRLSEDPLSHNFVSLNSTDP